MRESEAIWFLPGDDGRPAGPYTVCEVIERLQDGRVDGETPCWCDGMVDWQALSTVDVFVGAAISIAAPTEETRIEEVKETPGEILNATESDRQPESSAESIDAVWFLRDDQDQAAGPYVLDQVVRMVHNGQVAETTDCWRKDMDAWQPLSEIQDVTDALTRFRAERRRRARRVSAVWGVAICAVAVVGVGWILAMGPPEIRQASKLTAAGCHVEASRVLEPFLLQHPDHHQAVYMLAVSKTNEFATAESRTDFFSPIHGTQVLKEAKKLFDRAFVGDAKWRDQAGSDLADAFTRVPSDAMDGLARCLDIANLQADLGVAEEKSLARDLLTELTARTETTLSQPPVTQSVTNRIVGWDSKLAPKVIACSLPGPHVEPMHFNRAVRTLRDCAKKHPAIAKALPTVFIERADKSIAAGACTQAEILLFEAGRSAPFMPEEVAGHWIRCLKALMKRGEALRVLGVLKGMSRESPERTKTAVAALYIDAAEQLRISQQAKARESLNIAIKLDPDTAGTDRVTRLRIDLAQRANKVKLDLCLDFLNRFPASAHRGHVLQTVVSDTPMVFKTYSRWNRAAAMPYLDKAQKAAIELIKSNDKQPGLGDSILSLARCLANHEQKDNALQLLEFLLQEIPGMKDRGEITGEVATLRAPKRPSTPPQADKPKSAAAGRNRAAEKRSPAKQRAKRTEDRITDVRTRKALNAVLANLNRHRVIWIHLRKDEVPSEALKHLRNEWVKKQGGVLWMDTDLIESVGYFSKKTEKANQAEGTARVAGTAHSITKDIRGQEVGYSLSSDRLLIRASKRVLKNDNLTPLLLSHAKDDAQLLVCLVYKYGNGWIVYRPTRIDTSSKAAERFADRLLTYSLQHAERARATIDSSDQSKQRTTPRRPSRRRDR